ncbi:Vacuolar assembly protein VPS41 [Aphelenchoides avenae]|nr:Vacuolar assembly protein VPS41 [Aphelenchus avenae]
MTAVTSSFSLSPGQRSCACVSVLQPVSLDQCDVVSDDTINMKNADPKFLSKFHMQGLAHDSMYFMLSPKELMLARPCSVDDRVEWFMENQLYVEAVECAVENQDALTNKSVQDIGKVLIEHLIQRKDFAAAASYLPQICGRRKDEWETYVNEFDKHKQVLKIVPVIPTKTPTLEPECYELVLIAALYYSPALFRKLVLAWNADIYRAASIINKVLHLMEEEHHAKSMSASAMNRVREFSRDDLINLYKALAHLYAYTRDFERAISMYMLLNDETVFDVIRRHGIFHLVKDNIVKLMEINRDLAIRLFIENGDSIPSSQVIAQLHNFPKLQMEYLNMLMARGEGTQFANLLIRLYADHAPQKLLPFLRKHSDTYKIDQALEICTRKKFTEATVFLLGRSGDRQEALKVIMKELGDIDVAIEFCIEHQDDVELWDKLLTLAFDPKPNHEYITKLLKKAGAFLKPLDVVQKITTNVDIPGIKGALIKVIRDNELRIELLRESQRAQADDVVALFRGLVRHPLTGLKVDDDNDCPMCR